MKVKIRRKMEVEDVVDVTFPVFIKTYDIYDSGTSWETIMRIDSDGSTWRVTERDNGRDQHDYEFDAGKIVIEHELAQWLEASGRAETTEAEFVALVQRAAAVLVSFPTGTEAVGTPPSGGTSASRK